MTEDSAATEDKRVIPVLRIEQVIVELPDAIVNLLQRTHRAQVDAFHPGMLAFLSNTIRVSTATWRAVSRLTLDITDNQTPPSTLATAVPPLARTLLESVMAIVFIFEDPADRLDWFYRAGWREAREHQAKLEKRFGALTAWRPWLDEKAGWIASHDSDFGITSAERVDPKLATARWKNVNPSHGFWPNPGRMRRIVKDPARGAFLGFVNDWMYGRLSGDSHLTYIGLAGRGGILHSQPPATRAAYRDGVVLSALSLYVAVLSEVIAAVRLDSQVERTRGVWKLLKPYGEAADLWTERYEALLQK